MARRLWQTFKSRIEGIGIADAGRRDEHSGRWMRGAVLLIAFAAFSLHTGVLTLQSMWIDEVMSLYFTRGDFWETVRTIVQPQHNGPLYYLLIFWWRQVVGNSDFAIRYLSVAFTILTIALLFQWARRLLTGRTAVLVAWLFAFSPFILWSAQEARMYALHMMVSVAASLALLEAFRKGRWYRWVLYTVLASTVLYSHFFGGFLIAAHAVTAVLLGWRRKKRLLAYVTAMVLLGLAHIPLLRIAWHVLLRYNPRDNWRSFVPLGDMIRDMVGQYFYHTPVADLSWPLFLLPAGLVLAGILFLLWRKDEADVVVLQALVPVLIFYPASFQVPVYAAKYLSATLPAVLLLAAWGGEALARLWRPAGVLVLVLGLLMMSASVRDLTDPAMQKPDWRFVAEYIEAHEGPNDVVVISAFYMDYAFERYYQGRSDVLGFEGNPYAPSPYYQDMMERYDHLWLVLHHDQFMAPDNQLVSVADSAFSKMTVQFPNAGQIRFMGYQMHPTVPMLPETARPMDVCFENGLCLVGYQVDATALTATENLSHPPSNWLHVVLYWRREPEVLDLPFRPLVRLVDGSYSVWGGNMDDRRPDLFERVPPTEWPLDEIVETHFDLNLNPITPPGPYHLEASLAIYGDEGRRVTVVNPEPGLPEDRFVFEVIQILPE